MGFFDALQRESRVVAGELKEIGGRVAENAAEMQEQEGQGVDFDAMVQEQHQQDPFAGVRREPDFMLPPEEPPERQTPDWRRGGSVGNEFADIAEELDDRDQRDKPPWWF